MRLGEKEIRLGSAQRVIEVSKQIARVFQPDREAQDGVARLGSRGDRAVGQAGRVLDQGVDAAQGHRVRDQPNALGDGRGRLIPASQFHSEDRSRTGHLATDEAARILARE